MHIYKTKRGGRLQTVLLVAVFLAAVLIFAFVSSSLEKNSGERQTELLKEAIDNALVSSYATKGYYPDSLEHLLEEYGITFDGDKYIVTYEVFAKNIRPSVRIITIEN